MSEVVDITELIRLRQRVVVLDRYLAEGNPPDPPGRFLMWLAEREPVYGFRFSESWLDIGDPTQLLEADNLYRAASGLPERESYAL